jgi:transcriptional regulator with XRE-family HTH domain
VSDLGFATRLKSVITEAGLTHVQFARRVFVTHPTVSKWLRGMVPRRAAVDAICRRFDLSRDWLLRGEGARTAGDDGPNADQRRFAEYLAQAVDCGEEIISASDNEQLYAEYLVEAEALAGEFAEMVSQYEGLADQGDTIAERARDKVRELTAQFHARLGLLAVSKNAPFKRNDLPTSTTPSKETAMRIPNLDELLAEVRTLTEHAGARKALAESIGVSQPQLSRWLSLQRGSAYSPSATNALKLLRWVTGKRGANEKESPEGALTPPERVTRRRSSKHETKTSDRKKSSHKGRKRTTKKG